jgi:hypothetical protein
VIATWDDLQEWIGKLSFAESDLWVPERMDLGVRGLYVYLILKEYPPARACLERAKEEFQEENASDFQGLRQNFWQTIDWTIRHMTRPQHPVPVWELGALWEHVEDMMPRVLDGDTIFVRLWAHGGWAELPRSITRNLRFLAMGEAVIEALGLDPRVLRGNSQLLRVLPPDRRKFFKVLLSSHKPRAEETIRRVARQGVRARGFHLRHEETLVKSAFCWFLYRPLMWSYERISPQSKWSGSKAMAMDAHNFYSKLIAPIDKALEYKPPRGRRPQEAKLAPRTVTV